MCLSTRRVGSGNFVTRYHLYYLRGGMLVGSADIEAASDDEAARIAREQSDGEVVEVWNDHERVRIVACAPTVAA